jgi:hypothetical protein
MAGLHGGKYHHRYARQQPYDARISSPNTMPSHGTLKLPFTLLEKIKNTQDAAVNITMQKKDASWLREFLSFCEGLGISAINALPAREVLLACVSSYAGRIAGKTLERNCMLYRRSTKDATSLGLVETVYAES